MNSQRISEIEDGAKMRKDELVFAFIFTGVVFLFLTAFLCLVCYAVRSRMF